MEAGLGVPCPLGAYSQWARQRLKQIEAPDGNGRAVCGAQSSLLIQPQPNPGKLLEEVVPAPAFHVFQGERGLHGQGGEGKVVSDLGSSCGCLSRSGKAPGAGLEVWRR